MVTVGHVGCWYIRVGGGLDCRRGVVECGRCRWNSGIGRWSFVRNAELDLGLNGVVVVEPGIGQHYRCFEVTEIRRKFVIIVNKSSGSNDLL